MRTSDILKRVAYLLTLYNRKERLKFYGFVESQIMLLGGNEKEKLGKREKKEKKAT